MDIINVYTALFVTGYFGAILTTFKNTTKINKILYCGFAIMLFVLSGFRALNVGYDTEGHLEIFSRVATGAIAFSDFKEPGYSLLSYVIATLGDFHLFLIIYSILSLAILSRVVKEFSINPFISIFIYFSFYFLENNMAKLRTSMAVTFLLLAFLYLYKKKKKIYYVVVMIAGSFHNFAFAYILLPLINKISINRKRMLVGIVLAVIIGQSGLPEFIYRDVLVNSSIVSRLNITALNNLVRYSDMHYTVREGGGYFGYLYVLINSFLVVYFFNKLRSEKSKKAIFLATLYYWGTIIFFTLFNLALINSRITMALLMTQTLLAPYLFNCVKDKYLRILFTVIYLLGVFIRGYFNFTASYDLFVPFQFFWQ